MACPLHTPIPVCTQRKKPRGWFQGKPAYYEEETWVSSLDENSPEGQIGWADKYSAEGYGKVIHGELHGCKTLEEALNYE